VGGRQRPLVSVKTVQNLHSALTAREAPPQPIDSMVERGTRTLDPGIMRTGVEAASLTNQRLAGSRSAPMAVYVLDATADGRLWLYRICTVPDRACWRRPACAPLSSQPFPAGGSGPCRQKNAIQAPCSIPEAEAVGFRHEAIKTPLILHSTAEIPGVYLQ
jgi:hypothetical protein